MNTKLAVATHILTLLHAQNDMPVTSDYIAGSVNTNASLIRRMLGQLAKAGLTHSQLGAGGGAKLARPANEITLLDVYNAIEKKRDILGIHSTPNMQCPVGRQIRDILNKRFKIAEQALFDQLAHITIDQLIKDSTN